MEGKEHETLPLNSLSQRRKLTISAYPPIWKSFPFLFLLLATFRKLKQFDTRIIKMIYDDRIL